VAETRAFLMRCQRKWMAFAAEDETIELGSVKFFDKATGHPYNNKGCE